MCEPKAGTGLSDLALLLLATKTGRGLLAAATVAFCLYLSTQLVVTLPLIVPLVLGGLALAGVVTSLLYRQQSKANAAAAYAARNELTGAEQTILALRYELRGPAVVHAERVPELEAARPAVDALPAVVVREDA